MSPLHSGPHRVVGLTLAVSPLAAVPASAATVPPPLMITELAPDSAGADHFEFIEVTNTTGAPIDLSQASLAYVYVDGADRTRDVPLLVPAGTVVEPGESVVLWLSYASGTVDSFARTEQDFRDHWAAQGAGTDYRLVRVEGQPGMANGGDRGVRLTLPDGRATWSYYPAGSVAAGRTAQFRADAARESGTALLEGRAGGLRRLHDRLPLPGRRPDEQQRGHLADRPGVLRPAARGDGGPLDQEREERPPHRRGLRRPLRHHPRGRLQAGRGPHRGHGQQRRPRDRGGHEDRVLGQPGLLQPRRRRRHPGGPGHPVRRRPGGRRAPAPARPRPRLPPAVSAPNRRRRVSWCRRRTRRRP
ncbi:lamin tail domain-containing protein [Micrococcus flavus]|uniref:Uncharacterized protein n=1 Tax=Micrococcus flavus TaxID=384602 RepID=A0A4Y8X0Q7_9MICC|nr:hypothetical protein [Micrococcus flavus]TFI02731.1 lamin tail domain-containing protein [Micrococcus flavus]